jgi:hypothetical protein
MAWGLCKDCKWWQIEPSSRGGERTLGMCIEEKLQRFHLRINGSGGCDRFGAGSPAHAKGSSEAPPSAKPLR